METRSPQRPGLRLRLFAAHGSAGDGHPAWEVPPLVLGALKQQTGSYTPGFLCLALFSLLCLGVLLLTRPRAGQPVAAS